jgi:hypothetical protein
MSKPIVLVDFDGVIHSYKSGWQGVASIPDRPVPGAIEWLVDHLVIPGHNEPEFVVQIYSSRSKEQIGLDAMKKWLIKHGVNPAYIDEGILEFPTEKPAAFLTIDDRCICFEGKFPRDEDILNFKPWNKREVPPISRKVV